MKKMGKRSDCPVSFALETFGDTWSLLIIRDLLFFGKTYYGDFLKSDEKIATNILADRLFRLEQAGIIEKIPSAKDKRRDAYQLRDKGIDLLPVLIEMMVWSAKYDSKTAAQKSFVAEAKNHREQLIKQIRTALKQNRVLFKSI
ncbi:MAG: helix-turn-helix domain-containing protein [Patescibacteria group bacterium]